MKKSKKTIIFAACALLALLTTACSNDDVVDGNKNGQIDAKKNIEFSLKFDDYNAGDTIDHATRAAQDAELAKPHIIPMGDMMYAKVSMQRDTTKATPKEKAAATRALSDGTYTIYAYQGTTLKGTLTGTVTSNVFTPTSSNQEIYLEPGTYTFVCCNDKVHVSGETWTIDRTDAETARIGIVTGKVVTATPSKQKVAFEMKHVGSRVLIRLQADGFPIWDATATLTSTTNIPSKIDFNTSTQTYSTISDIPLSENITFYPGKLNDFKFSHDAVDSYYVRYIHPLYGAIWANKYFYFLPTTSGTRLKLTLTGGTSYRLPLSGRSVKFPTLTSMDPNGSYILRMNLHYNYFYLFSDGTIGQKTDANFSSKTPIAVVVSRSKRIAAALNDIDTRTISNYKWGKDNTTTTTTASPTLSNHLSDLNGYDLTYSTTYSTDGIVKGNDATNYPAFYAAAHYNPGVTVTGANVGKWYLPSMGEWNLFFKNLVILSNRDLQDNHAFPRYDYGNLRPETYAINVTDPVSYYTPGGKKYFWQYLSSSEYSQAQFYSYCPQIVTSDFYFPQGNMGSDYEIYTLYKNQVTDISGSTSDNPILLIRPFVHY